MHCRGAKSNYYCSLHVVSSYVYSLAQGLRQRSLFGGEFNCAVEPLSMA